MLAGEAHRAMRSLPAASLDTLLNGRSPLVLAPHPDDESLGCGGLIAAAVGAGLAPFVAVLTDGTGSHPSSRAYPAERLRAVREAETRDAVAALGLAADRLVFLRERDTAAPTSGPALAAVADRLAQLCIRSGCGVLLAPWEHDPHCDHEAAHLLARAVAGKLGLPHLSYPVWGWTLADGLELRGPLPQGWRLDVAAHLPAKRSAIAAHRSQHGQVIPDDPTGFTLPAEFLSFFAAPFETYLTNDPC